MQLYARGATTEKVGGWLLLMCYLLMYVGPATSILGTFARFTELERFGIAFQSNFGAYKFWTWAVVLLCVAFSALAGYQLKNELVPETIAKVKQLIWTAFVGGTVMNAIVLPYFFLGLNMDQVVSGVLLTIFSFFVALGYTQYLSKSKRVQDTFGISVQELQVGTESSATTSAVKSSPTQNVISDDESLWAHAICEFEGEGRRVGLWAKSFSHADGNEAQAKAQYLKLRVAELTAVRNGEVTGYSPE
jgi:hypothetical protein